MNQEFDYIVIGSGSAGGTLAARLSASGEHTVLLIEAGGSHRQLLVDMPAGWGRMAFDKRYSWGHETEPERWAGGRRMKIPRGKMLGGSSSINGLLYVRGHRQDYADWVSAGAAGWSWPELLPHFIRTEGQQHLDNNLHGRGGPLIAANQKNTDPITDAMIEAAVQAGLERVDDFNDGNAGGAGIYQVNVLDGRRSSIARNAIDPAMSRTNLTVLTQATVQCITLSGRTATGVKYRLPDGSEQLAKARREVLLCAGAIHSPQLLMLSGIGPAAHLQEHGIAVAADLPGVGQNLQDHVIAPMTWRLRPEVPGMNAAFRGIGLAGSMLRYLFTRGGAMTSAASEFGCYFRSDPALNYNDIQVFGLPVTGATEQTVNLGQSPKPESIPGFTLAPNQIRPWSRGSIQLKASDARVHPALRMNYLDDERDRKALLYSLRFLRRMVEQPALAKLVAAETRPGPALHTDAELLEWLAPTITTGHHAVGTCRMGRLDDPFAVVTPDLRVRGVERLRVIDASVMPNIISGNTNATTVVIGDKGADLVLGRAALAPMDS
ncbi:choline dehydrogenase [Collimonas sp. OK607]|uniref:GMC family oxidoreductase n=1 Tax=Collimonas sp. OK607 TaxID=1798194 RepID=UPI0008E8B12E|nr:GMC family oxidoreductase N-terminal domain-containing protein [Collimonas sp. OK607]SFA82845.1 choline dehydrogenase [Collimonas sp. OK607]